MSSFFFLELQLITILLIICDSIVWTPPPYIFKRGQEVNFNYLLQRGESEKLKKKGGSMVQGQVFLKRGAGTFPISFFQGLSFLHLEITLPFAKLCYAFKEKLFLSATIIL